jgi:cellobiose transport system permease protein
MVSGGETDTPRVSPPPIPSSPPTPTRPTARQRLAAWDVRFAPYLYISPFFVLFAVVGLFPLAYTAYVSVHDWSLLGGQGDYIGLQNYREVLDNPYFVKQLVNTISIFVL